MDGADFDAWCNAVSASSSSATTASEATRATVTVTQQPPPLPHSWQGPSRNRRGRAQPPSPPESPQPLQVVSGTDDHPSDGGRRYNVWKHHIIQPMAPYRLARGKQLRKARIASFCSGAGPERMVVPEMEVDADFIFTCDNNEKCYRFIQENGPQPQHHFIDGRQLLAENCTALSCITHMGKPSRREHR